MFPLSELPKSSFARVSGKWAPRKTKMQFPPRKPFNENEGLENYVEQRIPYQTDRGVANLGLYTRRDFLDCPYPPVVVIAGGLGFGGPITANSWKPYLKHWNPIIIDTFGAGNSSPMADLQAQDVEKTVTMITDIVCQFGLQEVGFLGYSFAGSLALLVADRMSRTGCDIPFVGAISPTLVTSDRDWCFDINAIGQKFNDDSRTSGLRRWDDLIEPLQRQGIMINTDNILNSYAQSLRSSDVDKALDMFVRMRKWEDVPYLHLPDDFDGAFVKTIVSLGLKEGMTVENFIADLTKGKAGLEYYFYNEDEYIAANKGNQSVDLSQRRTEIRQARSLARYIGNIMIWTESWQNNCGMGQSGIVPQLAYLKDQNTNVLITINDKDPLVPTGQIDEWISAYPQAIKVMDANGHGQCTEEVKQTLYQWLEDRRMDYCAPDRQAIRSERNQENRVWELDLGDALRVTRDPILASLTFLMSQRGCKDSIQTNALFLLNALGPQPALQEAENFLSQDNIDVSPYELRRILPFATSKMAFVCQG